MSINFVFIPKALIYKKHSFIQEPRSIVQDKTGLILLSYPRNEEDIDHAAYDIDH